MIPDAQRSGQLWTLGPMAGCPRPVGGIPQWRLIKRARDALVLVASRPQRRGDRPESSGRDRTPRESSAGPEPRVEPPVDRNPPDQPNPPSPSDTREPPISSWP